MAMGKAPEYLLGALLTHDQVYWILFIISSITLILQISLNKETNPQILKKQFPPRGLVDRIFRKVDWELSSGATNAERVSRGAVADAMLRPWKA